MAKDADGMKGNRSRNKTGELRNTRDDKHVGTLEKQYKRDYGVRSNMHVSTLLEKRGVGSVNNLITGKKKTGSI